MDDHAMFAEDYLAQNGTTDSKGQPANKLKTGGWRSCLCIFGNEIIDRIAFFGIASNLITYMTTVLQQGTAESARNVNNWHGTIYILPLLGGFAADTFWGRYWTTAISSGVYLLGLLLLTLSASVKSLKPSICHHHPSSHCSGATTEQLAFFYFSLYLIALGSGAMKPCVLSFGGDQFDETDPSEMKHKASFFNWWVWGVHAGSLLAVTVLVYIQDNIGWGWGFGIPAVAMALAVIIFFSGTRLYRYRQPHGSPLTTIAQVLVAAIRKSDVKMPPDFHPPRFYEQNYNTEGKRLLSHTNQCLFLDRAAFKVEEDEITLKSGSQPNPWKLCSVTQVEETKLVVKIVPIWLGTLLFSSAVSQIPTLFVRQASTMDNRVGSFRIPPASMNLFTSMTVLVFVPIYDRLLVPLMRGVTNNQRGISMLQRMGIGIVIAIVAMVSAATTENKRLHEAKEKVLMSIFWLLPQYILIGLAEAFTYIGQLEFFYDQAPDSMRSLGLACQLTSIGVGSFLSSTLIAIVDKVTSHKRGTQPWIHHNINNGRLDNFYLLLAALNATSFLLIYLPVAWCYKYKNQPQTPADH